MNYIQKSSIGKLIRSEGYRLSPGAIDGINRTVEDIVKSMLTRVEADGMKTLMIQHTVTQTKRESNGRCKRCCNIKDQFMQWARATQDTCHEWAVVLSRKV